MLFNDITAQFFSGAQLFGYLSFVLGVLTFYQKNDRRLKMLMLLLTLNHAVHFALLGAVAACASALLSLLRTSVSLYTRSHRVAYGFMLAGALMGYWVADTPADMLPIFGTTIGTYALFCLQGIVMRFAFLVGGACWLANNFIIGSIGGTALEALLMSVNVLTIWRLWRDRAAVC
ncbi:YgjV family protein [Photobacterium japonica]|uniref:YgjV family protein n=1 Tax=Photobacterium japonica TaxID=2910235 RepID=UPI003D10EF2F